MTEQRTPKVRAYGQGLTRHLIIRCSDEHVDRWREAADKAGVGLSEWIREKLDKATEVTE